MDYVQSIISLYEENYDLTVYLVDKNGLVQSSTDVEFIEEYNVFNDFDAEISNQIIAEKENLLTLDNRNHSNYIITRYIDDLDWYIIVQKDVNVFAKFFIDYFWISLIMIIVILSVVSYIIILTINQYQNRIYNLANTDYLTMLLNRRGFMGYIDKVKENHQAILLFMIDIDGFKHINDEYGHSYGDEILKQIAKILNKAVDDVGKLSRWGGDEFIGCLIGESKENKEILVSLIDLISSDESLKTKNITISIGYTYTDFSDNFDVTLNHIDEALYEAKEKGGNVAVVKK